MDAMTPWLIGLAVLVALIAAFRMDALRLLWSQWLGMNRQDSVAPPPGRPVQNPAPGPSAHANPGHKPDFHRSGGRRH